MYRIQEASQVSNMSDTKGLAPDAAASLGNSGKQQDGDEASPDVLV